MSSASTDGAGPVGPRPQQTPISPSQGTLADGSGLSVRRPAPLIRGARVRLMRPGLRRPDLRRPGLRRPGRSARAGGADEPDGRVTELRGRILDRESGRALEARVHVRASTGEVHTPPDAIRKVGPGESFFYADGTFELDLPPGPAEIVLERGTEFRPLQVVDVPAGARWR